MSNSTVPVVVPSRFTTFASSIVSATDALARCFCATDSQRVYCTSRFWTDDPNPSPAARWGTILIYLVMLFSFLTAYSPRAHQSFTYLVCLPARHLPRAPAPLHSYLKSSPFTLVVLAPLDLACLGLFYKSAIPWRHRFHAVHIFQARAGSDHARTATKRVLFSLNWTVSALLLADDWAVRGKTHGYMLIMIGAEVAALLPSCLALWCGSQTDALGLAVRAQEMGDEKGQPGEMLGNLVGVPPEWRRKFEEFEVGYACWIHVVIGACWIHVVIGACCVCAQEVVALSWKEDTPTGGGKLDLTGRRLSAPVMSFGSPSWVVLYGVLLAFGCSACVGVFSMWAGRNIRVAEVNKRLVSASFASLWFALVLKGLGIPCDWTVWIACDAMLWAVDEWWARRQVRTLLKEFAEIVEERKTISKIMDGKLTATGVPDMDCKDKRRDMYAEVQVPAP